MVFKNGSRLSYRDILVAALILLFAFGLRVVVVFDRAANDYLAFDPVPVGSDQRHYLSYAEGYEAGRWPDGPFRYQPGMVYYLVGIRAIVGPSLGLTRLVMAVVGALACGLMVGVGWLLTGRRWGGYLAGLLLAVYPVAIFYSTVILIPGIATFYVVVYLFLVLWQRQKLSLWRSALLGIVLGVLTITRTNLALIGLAWLFFLALYVSRRDLLVHAGVSLASMALMIAPVTLWNFQQGSSQLITSVGMQEIYRANNRDANGIYVSRLPALDVVEDKRYLEMLAYEIRRDPRRFVELQIRKVSLYWSALEPANNIDYIASGEAASPLLRSIPLDFRLLSVFGLIGLAALYEQDRRLGLYFASVIALMFIGVIVIWVEARVRQPVVAPLVATSAYLGVHLADYIRARRWPRPARRHALLLVALAGILVWFDWAVDALPQQRPVSELPADLIRMDVTFDERLRLVGWRPLAEWPAAVRGWGYPDNAYVIEWYWEVLEPVDEDYNAYIAYIDSGRRYAGRDTVIGAISYRPHPTSMWQPREIYREIIGFRLSSLIPVERSGSIRLGVYRVEGDFTYEQDTRVPIDVLATSLPDRPGEIVLQNFAVFSHAETSAPQNTPLYVFGDQLALLDFELPSNLPAGDPLNLNFLWTAVNEVPANYALFVHVMDEAGELAAQYDGPPRGGTLLTNNWSPGYAVDDEIMLTLPDSAGLYRVYIGWYDQDTRERLEVDAPDNRLLLGEFTVN